ncbi:hypothetical protein [Streptomyces sp. NPDC057682]|uniref:hypothetical protein n=1 Tax=Streptomyces sp. NPDC057682 TaxID=3346210 RepID=UPI0036AB184E
MKYLVMVQGSQADYETMRGNPQAGAVAWSEEDVRAMFAFMGALNDELTRSGELVPARGPSSSGPSATMGAMCDAYGRGRGPPRPTTHDGQTAANHCISGDFTGRGTPGSQSSGP